MSNNEIIMLKLLLENKETPLSIRTIAGKLKINYRIAYETSLNLEKEKLVEIRRIGNANLCTLGKKFNGKVFLAEELRCNDLCKNKDFLVIQNKLQKLPFGFVALIFGSYAKGTATQKSDIDLLTIGGDAKEIEKTIRLLPYNIHLTAILVADFTTMAKSKEFTVVSEALKKNIIIVGTEQYYRLLENA